MEKQINFTGLNRAVPQSKSPDGACQEMINVRHRKGCIRPIPGKTVLGSASYTYLGNPISFDYKLGDAIYLHDIEGGLNGLPNWIGVKSNAIYRINTITNIVTLLEGSLNTDIPINVEFLKRFLMVATGSGLLIYLFSEGSYTRIEALPVPDVELIRTNQFMVDYPTINRTDLPNGTPEKTTKDSVAGNYFDVLNSQSNNEGRLYGSLMYVSAYRLFDGSYILPSIPRYVELSNDGILIQQNVTGDGSYQIWFKFTVAGLKASIDNLAYPAVPDGTKDLIESICIFATRATPLHKIDTTTLDRVVLNFPTDGNIKVDLFSNFLPINADFSKLNESEGWFKIHEFAFDKVVGAPGRTTVDVDTKGYYQDYATRETLSTDQFTHHKIIAKSLYTYNDRLHASSIKTLYGSPYVLWPKFKEGYDMGNATVTGNITVWLKTALGKAIKTSAISIPTYRAATTITFSHTTLALAETNLASVIATPPANFIAGSAYIRKLTLPSGFVLPITPINTDWQYPYNEVANVITYQVVYRTYTAGASIIVPSVIGYNDSRAYRMMVTYNNGTQDLTIIDKPLKKNVGMNFAFYNSDKFSANELSTTDNFKDLITQTSYLSIVTTIPTAIQTPFDPNRMQLSEIQNPLILPAKYSYQIGTGEIIKVMSGSEPLSTGQFGQYPVQVFTTKGIYALEVGTGEVLYASIVPSEAEVAENPKNIISVSGGVVYSTVKGLFVLVGRKSTRLSEIVEGLPEASLTSKTEIITLLTDAMFTPALVNSLSDIDFLDYLDGSSVGFDQPNKELIVSNPDKSYSYIYSFESKMWYKTSLSYSLFIPNWPELYGISGTVVYNLSRELTTGLVDVMIITCAQSLELPDTFKKIGRNILRSNITTGATKQAGYYVFASDDVETYQLITGRQGTGVGIKDVVCQRSHGSSKYYVFVINGQMSVDSEINEIDLMFEAKWNGKLR